jgi:hypothetical protein
MKSEVEKVKPTVETVQMSQTALSKITGKYFVKPCRKTWLHGLNPNHDGATLFSNTQIWIVPERVASNPDVVNTGLTKEEQVEFEQEMNLQPGSLSPYNKAWWSKMTNIIKVPKEGLELDCDNNVKHKLWYKLLMNNSKVAKSKEDLTFNSFADVVITSKEQEAKVDTQKFKMKSRAFEKYATMSQADKINFLKVYDDGKYKVNNSSKPDLIESALGAIVDEKPAEFLATFDEPFYKDYILFEDLVSANIINRKGGRYFVNGGVEIGASKAQVVSNLRSDDYQDLKISLIAKLEARK